MKDLYDHSNPENWIWGLFYYNKKDPRILPPKRNEWLGWTVNFANPKSVTIFLAMIVLFLAFILFIGNRS